jgi:aspartate/methionine/tyrosine aminotransferase
MSGPKVKRDPEVPAEWAGRVLPSRAMTLPRLQHLAFSKTEPRRLRFSLAESAIATPDLAALGLPHQIEFPREYHAGNEALERELAARIAAPGGRVVVTAGASEAYAAAILALVEPGAEVLVESWGYEPHRVVPAVLGRTVRTFERPRTAGSLAAAIEPAIRPVTRLILVSDLHNPDSVPLDPGDVAALEVLATRARVPLLCDETFRDAGPRPPGTLAARGGPWLTISTLTKIYGMGDLRIGWVAGNGETLARVANAQNALSVQASLPAIEFAHKLVPHLETLRARSHRILADNHARWREFAAAHPRLHADAAPGGTVTWLDFGAAGAGDAFAAFAAERFDLAVAPGGFFGDARGVRIGLGYEPSRFASALEALSRAVAAFEFQSVTG